jgi:hypothetical protein
MISVFRDSSDWVYKGLLCRCARMLRRWSITQRT